PFQILVRSAPLVSIERIFVGSFPDSESGKLVVSRSFDFSHAVHSVRDKNPRGNQLPRFRIREAAHKDSLDAHRGRRPY
ncbi:MAG: hypothetical protein VYC71_15255, partial [Planctomycetota bacterium]|nr:hypothetical protein [Planctomycetota bacterium]